MKNKPLCKKNHQVKFLYFCQSCANSNSKDKCLYCKICNPEINQSHDYHSNYKKSLESQQFKKKFNAFTYYIQSQVAKMMSGLIQNNGQQNSKIQRLIVSFALSKNGFTSKVIHPQFSMKQFNDYQFRAWMLSIKFWTFEKQPKAQSIQKLTCFLKEDLDKNQQIKQIILNSSILEEGSKLKAQFKIRWDNIEQSKIDPYEEYKKAQIKCIQLTRQGQIINFLIKLYSSFNIKDCQKCINQLNQLLQKYPNQQILYFSKIRLLQLLPKGHQKIIQVLEKIQLITKDFKKSAIYYYYKAMSYWIMILPGIKIIDQMKYLFYQPKNKQQYYISNVSQYVEQLTQAIKIQQNQAYYSARGIGYIVQNKYDQAAQDFKKAIQKINYNNLQNNLNYTLSKQNKIRDQIILQGIGNKSRQFIVNAAKYFKKSKKYDKVVQCCRQLLKKQPKNQLIQTQFVKALCSGNVNDGKINQAQSQFKKLKNLKKIKEDEIFKLERRLRMAKGRNLWEKGQNTQAEQIFEILAQNQRSPTALYNYAAALYQSNEYQKALEKINKALELKQSRKYHILKMYICCMLKDFDSTKVQLQSINDQSGEFKILKEFIQDQ